MYTKQLIDDMTKYNI